MAGANLTIVYTHIQHSLLYLGWSLLYLYLVFVVQPLTYCLVVSADWLWLRWPWSGMRDALIRSAKAIVKIVSPELERRFLQPTPYGQYVGMDHQPGSLETKSIPFHSVSLNGCAWMLPYHIGVCEVLRQEKMVDENTIWLGSSGGALIAAAAALELDLEHQLKFCISTGIESSERHALGPVGKMSHYIAQHIRESMPDDAHKKTAGRLFISITETPQGARLYGNALVGNFKSRQHLYHVLMASSYIPMYYEVPPRPGIGAFYWDGGFSNNQPVLKGADGQILSTTISASSRRADICPSTQDTCNIEHLFPNKYETCMRIHQRGRRDALSYIRKLRASRKCKASGNA